MTFPAIEPYPEHLMHRGGSTELFVKEYLYLIEKAITNHPRSLQRRIGPSELGIACARRIGYKLLDVGPFNPFPDVPWLPTIGTACHAWLEDRFTEANGDAAKGDLRWLTELRVSVGEVGGVEVTGSVDLYDRCTATVTDHKIVGATPLKRYRSKGPGQQYRSQIHLYGRGITRRGAPVDNVVIAFLPRNGELRDAYFWSEPYDEQIALAALQRAEGIATAARALGTGVLPLLEPVENFCRRCEFHKPNSTDLAAGCPGVDTQRTSAAPALTLST